MKHTKQKSPVSFDVGKPLIFAAYPRVSTDEQRDGNSIDLQIQKIMEWSERYTKQPMQLYGIFDEDHTGFELQRPRMKEIIELAERGEINALVVSRMDRFARDRTVAATLARLLYNNGVRLFSVKEGEFTPGVMNVVVQAVFEAVGEQNAVVSKDNMRAARHGYIDKGAMQSQGIAPYGYAKQGKKGNTVLVIVEDQAEVVRYIFSLYIARVPLGNISDALNAAGTPHPQSAKAIGSRYNTAGWSRDIVRHVIHNMDKYHGEYLAYTRAVWRDADEGVKISIPPIIDDDTYEQARLIYDGARTTFFSAKKDHRIFLLGGRTTCGCGYSINKQVIKGRKDKIYDYYRCLSSYRKDSTSPCNGNYLPAVPVETVVWNCIAELIADPKAAIEKHKQRQSSTIDGSQQTLDMIAAIEESMADADDAYEVAKTVYASAVRRLDKKNATDARIIAQAQQVLDQQTDVWIETRRQFETLKQQQEAVLELDQVSNNQMVKLEYIAAKLREVLAGDVTPEKQLDALDKLRTRVTAIREDEDTVILIVTVLGQEQIEGERYEVRLTESVSAMRNPAHSVPRYTNAFTFRLTVNLRSYARKAR